MKVTVKEFLNVRVGKPRLNAPCYQYLAPGSELVVDGNLYPGDKYDGIDTWMKDEAGNYYWSGGFAESQMQISTNIAPWHDYLNLREVWKKGSGDGITIAVLDKCINIRNNDLADAIDISRSIAYVDDTIFVENDSHGTTMCQLIASRGRNGYLGVAPKAKIVFYGIAGKDYHDDNYATEYIMKALDEIERYDDIKIINMSFCTPLLSEYLSSPESNDLQKKIKKLSMKGKIFVAAAGNFDNDFIVYPARFENVLAIGAADYSENKLKISNKVYNRGPEMFCCCLSNNIKLKSDDSSLELDTSGASVIMAGLIANYLSSDLAAKVTYAEIINKIKSSLMDENRMPTNSKRIDNNVGYGFINPLQLIS